MLCDKCKKNEASYFSKITINGVTCEKCLCAKCAQAENINWIKEFDNDFFESPYEMFLPEEDTKEIYDDKNVIQQAMKAINKGANKAKNLPKDTIEIQSLKNQIHDAVEKEDYELASKLKKQLDNIQNKNKGE